MKKVSSIQVVILLVAIYLLIIIVRHAWLSDDAYITLRTLDNWINGYGLVYNVGERVQSYTHPLWMLLLAIPYSLTQEPYTAPYFTILLISIFVTTLAFSIFALRVANATSTILYGLLALSFSKAFIDYSTSGLENPLTYLLLACYSWTLLRTDLRNRHHFILTLICALGMLNRLDTALLFLPPLLYSLWYQLSWRRFYLTIAGMLPIIVWEIFSVVYYGFLLPNTAYAKLNTAIPQRELWQQGLAYYLDSLSRDPITLSLILMACLIILVHGQARRLAGVVGIALYLIYIARIGGDFMSGRFFAAPCFFAIILLPKFVTRETIPVPLLITIFLLGFSAPYSTWSSEKMPKDEIITERGIADERAYYRDSWLLDIRRVGSGLSISRTHGKHQRQGLEAHYSDQKVWAVSSAGQRGFYAGPGVYIFDEWALSDPLLARLPAKRDLEWRVGHYEREVPAGYLATLESGTNQLQDENLAQYYDQLSLIVHGDLWDRARWHAIWQMNLGVYDDLIDFERYRYPSVQVLSIQDMMDRPTQGEPWLHPDMLVASDSGILVTVDEEFSRSQLIEINVASHNHYQLIYLKGIERIGTQILLPTYFPPAAFYTHHLEIPTSASAAGFDRIHILPEWSPKTLDGFIDSDIEEIERADIFTVGQIILY